MNIGFYQPVYQILCPFGCGLNVFSNAVDQHAAVCPRVAPVRVLTGGKDNTLRLWCANTGELQRNFFGHKSSISSVIQVSQRVLASASYDNKICLWDVDGVLLSSLTGHTEYVECLTRIDANTIASGSRDDTVRIWDITTGQCTKVIKHRYDINALLYHAEAGLLITGADDKTIRCWNITNGQCVKELVGHEFGITAFAELEHAFGKCRLATGSVDRTIRIWDMATGKPTMVMEGDKATISSLAYLGRNILASCADTCLRVWDAATGICVRTFETEKIKSICALGPDTIACACEDGKIRIWSISMNQCIQIIEGFTNEPLTCITTIQWI
jgi:WD40 repeat protein